VFSIMYVFTILVIVELRWEDFMGCMGEYREGAMEADTEGGMEADTVGIITEAMHQEGPYSELFLVE